MMALWIDRYCTWITSNTKLTLTLIVLITLGLCSQLIHFTINPTPYFLDVEHPSRQAEKRTKETFTNTGEFIFIILKSKDSDIFNPTSLTTLSTLTTHIENLTLVTPNDIRRLQKLAKKGINPPLIEDIIQEGISVADAQKLQQLKQLLVQKNQKDTALYVDDLIHRLNPVKKVRSLATLDDLTVYTEGGEEIIDSFPLMEAVPTTQEDMDALKTRVTQNPMYPNFLLGGLANGDFSATSLQVELTLNEKDSPNMIALYESIDRLIKQYDTPDKLYFAGPPMVTAQTADSMASNNQRLMPYVVLIVLIILFLSFRTLQGVAIPLAIAIITTLWTLSVMAIYRIPQNIITTALPVFIISIAIADAIHFLSAYFVARQQHDQISAIKVTFRELITPLFITTVTTIVGFLAVSNTNIIFMREFGWFVALGIGFAFILTVTLQPVLLMLFDRSDKQNDYLQRAKGNETIGRIAAALVLQVYRHKIWVTIAFMALFITAGFSLKNLKVDNQVIGNFAADAPIRISDTLINKNFGGTTPFSIVLKSQTPDTFKKPDVLKAIDHIQQGLMRQATVGYSLSIVDFVKRAYQQQENTDYQLPDTDNPSVIAQYLFIYENAGQQEIRDVVNLSYDQTRLIISLNKDQSTEIDKVFSYIHKTLPNILPPGIDYEITGFAELLSTSTQEIAINQFSNNFVAIGCIFLILLVMLRSFPLACISMIPLLCTVYFVFALMAAAQIPLDIGTALISCITFGIGIDYAIHFIVILKQRVSRHPLLLDAVIDTSKKVAGPILINSISLAAGLLVTLTTDYKPVINLGLIIATAMVICAFITLILMPLMVLIIKPKSLSNTTPEDALLKI